MCAAAKGKVRWQSSGGQAGQQGSGGVPPSVPFCQSSAPICPGHCCEASTVVGLRGRQVRRARIAAYIRGSNLALLIVALS